MGEGALHELAIAEGIVGVALDHARGRSVSRVELSIGALRQVVPGALSFGFELVSRGTPLEGSELVIDFITARGRCRLCGHESELSQFPLCCVRCGGLDLEITAGEELHVKALELDEPVASGRAGP